MSLSAPVPTSGGNEADEITASITALARGLNYDSVRIFEYVHNYIGFEPYFGSKKGAHLTLLEGSGNDFDQCALLVALLSASGKSPTYKFGACYFSYTDFTKWVGLSTTPYSHLTDADFASQNGGLTAVPWKKRLAVYNFLTPRGYFYVDKFTSNGEEWFIIPHVWVEVTDAGTTRKLSPSRKDYDEFPGINLTTATGYSRSQLLADAAGTVTTSPDSVTSLNYSAVASRLGSYTQNLLSYLGTGNEHRRPVDQITGTRKIKELTYTGLTNIPEPIIWTGCPWLSVESWTAIPEVRMSKLQIQCGTWNYTASTPGFTSTIFDTTLKMPLLRGRKLSLTFTGNTARIYLDETLQGAAFTVTGATIDVRLNAIHNHYEKVDVAGGGYTDTKLGKNNQAETKPYFKADSNAYAFIYSLGNPDKTAQKRQEVLDGYRRSGLTETDWKVRTEILNVMGLQWLYQTWLQEQVIAPVFKVQNVYLHRFGRVAQESSYYIDVGMQFSAVEHRNQESLREADFLHFGGFISSAMEHGVIEQMQGEGKSASSTVKMIYLANQQAIPLYRATNANWTAVNAQLINYTAATQAEIQAAVTSSTDPAKALIPKNAQITLNQWKGLGYAIEQPYDIKMKISGDYFGGYNSQPGTVSLNSLATQIASDPSYSISNSGLLLRSPYAAYCTPQRISTDPVDMLSGAFLLDKTELTLGRSETTRGLTFSRHYNSNRRFDKSAGLGYGWTHNYQISAMKRSSIKGALAETISYHAAPFFTALLAASDLYTNHATAKEWATSALVVHWAVEQMKYNAVAISMGNKTIEFIKMPDGTYQAPAGMNLTLTRFGNPAGPNNVPPSTEYFTMTERHGSTYTFQVDGNLDFIEDLWNQKLDFIYSGSKLSQVKDAYLRTLTFNWTGDRISSVTDATGRSVGFAYTGDDLTGCTDVEGKTWTYTPDAEHRLTHLYDPSTRLIVRNFYDTESRVEEQRTFGDTDKTYFLSYTGFNNTEENPTGDRVSYRYDARGRSTVTFDALGNRTDLFYDGQDRTVKTISPENETTDYYYDKNNNLFHVWDTAGKHSYTSYDTQNRVETITDKRGKITTVNTYNAKFQPTKVTAPLSRITLTDYTSTGEVNTVTDPELNITDYDYNSLGQVEKIKINTLISQEFPLYTNRGDIEQSKDALGRITTMTYNKRRQPRITTLPAVPGEPAATIEQTYDNEGNLQNSIDARLNSTGYTYTATGKLKTTTYPAIPVGGPTGSLLNNVVTVGYNTRDWPENTVDSLAFTTSVIYDAAQRAKEKKDELNRTTKTDFDKNGRPKQVTDPLLRVTKMEYTPRGEVKKNIDGLTKQTVLGYDENGNRNSLKNRRGKDCIFGFDDASRHFKTTTPTLKETVTEYWRNDLPKKITEPSLQATDLVYDARLRLFTKTDNISKITYGYEDNGNLLTVSEGNATPATANPTLTRTYDERSRLRTFTNTDGDLIKYDYDAANNLTGLTYPPDTLYPAGRKVIYTYNARNQLETVKDWANRTTTYQYDRLGRLKGILRPNGTSQVIDLDAAGQVLSTRELAGTRLFHYQKFKYDLAGQVKEKFTAPQTHSWTPPAFAATYDNDNRFSTINGQSIGHDPDGNMTLGPITATSGSLSLAYNARNQLTGAGNLAYTYDAEGRRRTVVTSIPAIPATPTTAAVPASTLTTRYTIDPAGSLSCCLIKHDTSSLTPGTTTKTYYVYGLGLLYEATKIGAAAETTITHHYDQVGSTVVRTDDTGNDVGRAEYSPYGQLTWKTGKMNTPFLFVGGFGVMSDSNGLIYMRARFFSPYLMRFLNADPTGFDGGSNWYAYCGANPLLRADPEGEFWFIVGAIIGGGLDYAAQVTSNYASGKTGSAAWTDVNVTSIAISAGAGAITGGIGGAVSKQVVTVGGRAAANALANATVSVAAQISKNAAGVNGEAGQSNLYYGTVEAAGWGALTGGGGSILGDSIEKTAAYAAATYRAAAWNSATLASRQLAANATVSVPKTATGWVQPAFSAIGGAASNSISNWPWNPFSTSSPSSNK